MQSTFLGIERNLVKYKRDDTFRFYAFVLLFADALLVMACIYFDASSPWYLSVMCTIMVKPYLFPLSRTWYKAYKKNPFEGLLQLPHSKPKPGYLEEKIKRYRT